jgi:hypothetical protein
VRASSSKAPTARPPRPRTTSCTSAASWSCPTCSPTPAASPCPTSSGCRTSPASSGPRTRSTSASSASWSPPSPRSGRCTGEAGVAAHRRLHHRLRARARSARGARAVSLIRLMLAGASARLGYDGGQHRRNLAGAASSSSVRASAVSWPVPEWRQALRPLCTVPAAVDRLGRANFSRTINSPCRPPAHD